MAVLTPPTYHRIDRASSPTNSRRPDRFARHADVYSTRPVLTLRHRRRRRYRPPTPGCSRAASRARGPSGNGRCWPRRIGAGWALSFGGTGQRRISKSVCTSEQARGCVGTRPRRRRRRRRARANTECRPLPMIDGGFRCILTPFSNISACGNLRAVTCGGGPDRPVRRRGPGPSGTAARPHTQLRPHTRLHAALYASHTNAGHRTKRFGGEDAANPFWRSEPSRREALHAPHALCPLQAVIHILPAA